MAKRKSSASGYLGVVATLGLYGVYWTYSLVKDVENLAKERLETATVLVWLAAIALVSAIGCLGMIVLLSDLRAHDVWLVTLGLNSAIVYEALLIVALILVNRRLLKYENKPRNILADAIVALLTLLFFVSLPLIQSRLNHAIARHSHRTHGGSHRSKRPKGPTPTPKT